MDGTGVSFPNELARGTLVGGYKIRQRLGAGAAGTVYAALHPQNGRKVAIKVLHSATGAERIERLRERCAQLAALRHPGILAVQEVGRLQLGAASEAGPVFLISEFALGQPLTDLLAAAGPLAPEEARPLLEVLALILATAHGHDLVHGGLTPDNVWVTPRDGGAWPPMLRVMDFGLAELRHPEGSAPGVLDDEVPYYLSPEQCRGELARPASDIYALGVIGYQMLTGRVPFSSERPREVVRMHLEERVRPPSDLAPLAPGIDRFVLHALAREPRDRFQTMLQLRQALSAFDEEWPAAAPSPEASGYASYDLEDPRSGGTAGEIPARPTEEPSSSPRFEVDAVIVEPPSTSTRPSGPLEPPSTSAQPGAPLEGVTTAVLPILDHPPARSSPLFAAILGLALAALLGLCAYRVLAGSWPWQSDSSRAAEGQVRIVSAPPGARVYLNEIEQGATPLSLSLRQGQRYQIALRLAGHPPWQQSFALALGEEERQLKVVLAEGPPRFGTLKLQTSVAADFFLDGRKVGTQIRQLTLADVRAESDHELRIVAPGHQPLSEQVRVAAGSTRVLELTLQPIPSQGAP